MLRFIPVRYLLCWVVLFLGLYLRFRLSFCFLTGFFPMYMFFCERNGSVLMCSLRRPLSLLTVSPLPYKNLSFVFIMNLYLACLHLPPVGVCLWKLPRPERFAPPTDGQMIKNKNDRLSYLLYLEKGAILNTINTINHYELFWTNINK